MLRNKLRLIISAALIVATISSPVAALTPAQKKVIDSGARYFNVDVDTFSRTCSVSTGTAGVGSNADYAGRPILTQGQLTAIQANQPFYITAAEENNIPWQMIAVIHLKEHGLERSNPSNGQGIYQFYDKHGGPYPTGPVSDAEFQRQTNLAAQFIKSKAASNYPENRQLSTGADAAVIKDTFFSYNGRASAYEQQARSLGFGANQGYEGSPYVMNKADAQRDPDVNPTKWGQIKRDRGPIEYPANDDYGTFVVYASLAGLQASCNVGVNGPVRQRIVQLAQQELALWQNGTLKPGTGYFKYSQNRQENWCADFASWIYNQAGVPLRAGNDGNVAAVNEVKQIGINTGRYHEKAGYTPQPGDIVVRQNGISHVNLVISVDTAHNSMVIIGGNQGGGDFGFSASAVTQFTDSITSSNITGYVSPPEQ